MGKIGKNSFDIQESNRVSVLRILSKEDVLTRADLSRMTGLKQATITNIINDLLSLVKMDKTEGSMDISAVDINELLETTLKRLRPIARKRDIEVVLESLRPVTAEVDEVKMSQIFTNLVENAIKYNKEHGWVKVLLDADHQFFTVEVSDSGIGIPEQDYEHIYERFYRVDKSHSREIGGTGLGLAITRNAILLHRGSIKVSSVEGQGTTFTVKIPLSYIK